MKTLSALGVLPRKSNLKNHHRLGAADGALGRGIADHPPTRVEFIAFQEEWLGR